MSLIPLDDFSSVDTVANNLAHMVCSKEMRRCQTQARGDQELPYQVATHEPEEEEDYHHKNGT